MLPAPPAFLERLAATLLGPAELCSDDGPGMCDAGGVCCDGREAGSADLHGSGLVSGQGARATDACCCVLRLLPALCPPG